MPKTATGDLAANSDGSEYTAPSKTRIMYGETYNL